MLTYTYEYESDWVIKGRIHSDTTIVDLQYDSEKGQYVGDGFSIEIKDLFEHYIARDEHFFVEETYSKDNNPSLAIGNNVMLYSYESIEDACQDAVTYPTFISNVETYNNDDDINLVKNGFQFWITDDGYTLMFRMVARGRSTRNFLGYNVYGRRDSFTGFVGFTCATVSVSFNTNENIKFNVYLIPRLLTGDIQKINEDENDEQIGSAFARPDFNYNRNFNRYNRYNPYKDNMYVNNSVLTYSSKNTLKWMPNKDKYEIEELTGDPTYTPKYYVETSGYVSDYLQNGLTIDLLNGGSSARNFELPSAFSSRLVNESNNGIDLSADMVSSCTINPFEYFNDNNGGYIFDSMNVNIYQQIIEDLSGKKSGLIRNRVLFGVEI